jgi:hypothetical protein
MALDALRMYVYVTTTWALSISIKSVPHATTMALPVRFAVWLPLTFGASDFFSVVNHGICFKFFDKR